MMIISNPTQFKEWVSQFGIFDEIIFILLRTVQTVIKFMPAEPFEIAAGYVWSVVPGMLYCLIGNIIGTIIILVLTKKYGQKIFEFFIPTKNIKLFSIFKNTKNIYLLLFFLYLIPGLPKDGFTYFVGVLPIKVVPFLVITGFARMPSIISSTLCGSTLSNNQYAISILILLLTLLFSIIGVVIYKRIIKKKNSFKSTITK